MSSLSISVLDQSPIHPGETPEQALAHTVRLARRAEELGLRRFWVAEHHDSEQLAGSSPEALIGYLLARTERIRIGSGGVMLQHYSPYKVAETFHVLAALAPGRVDLGVGRAPGGLPRSTQALRQGAGSAGGPLEGKLEELSGYLGGRPLAEPHPLAGLRAAPAPAQPPLLHVLGASEESARSAGKLGLPYVFSLFIGADEELAIRAAQAYRESFDASSGRQPELIVAVAAVAADTDAAAEAQLTPQKVVKTHLQDGRTVTLGTREQAEEFGRQSGLEYRIEEKEAIVYAGSKETVGRKLRSLQAATGAAEFIVVTNVPDFSARLRSFELLAELVAEPAAGLEAGADAGLGVEAAAGLEAGAAAGEPA
ncbi:MsnO8 family LLM class oxidoreductase [Paenibacillus pasadenensis]|uniref:Bacterial luciferase family protein YtmO, in cluster with L-cystine ABC transporter n=1 Tax=Paenibacillus pasadenensis TaxID=217090 RepID=A0A2N5N0I4_9BACL|nr:MsnO8 family LLM class oxidoreductase [Paenibacillus pasadenensis]PLT43848.1 Bacterial luciferase family protein YtmO, in cluster with L-cystine ABC transporter [Paenibacillus pasadenensis]